MRNLLNTLICILLTSPLAAFDIALEGVEFGFLQMSLDGDSWFAGDEVLSETISLGEGDIMQVLQVTSGESRFTDYNLSYPKLFVTSQGVVTERNQAGYVVGPASIQVGYKFNINTTLSIWMKYYNDRLYFFRADYAILRAGASTQSSYVTIPANPSGNFEVKLQTSSDLQTWSPTTPGIFPYGDNAKFFRLVVE